MLSKFNAVRVRLNLSKVTASECMSIILKLMVSILSPSKGNKKYSSSAVTKVLEKLSTNFGMNCSTELRVLFDSNKQFNDDCLKEKSGLIKLLNSKFEFFESP